MQMQAIQQKADSTMLMAVQQVKSRTLVQRFAHKEQMEQKVCLYWAFQEWVQTAALQLIHDDCEWEAQRI
jgi:hypothetical protein